MKTDLLRTYVAAELSSGWRDFLSPLLRCKKRLIRAYVALVDAAEDLEGQTSYLEILVACAVPVMQGYWESRADRSTRVRVCDEFGTFLFNIILNAEYLPRESFQDAHKRDPHATMASIEREVQELLKTRTDEYMGALNTHIERRNQNPSAMNLPLELVSALSRNIYAGIDSAKRQGYEADIAVRFTMPFMAAYASGLHQFR